MLFKLAPDSPRFEVFRLLNAELMHFLEQAVHANAFNQTLFSVGAVGQACWENAKTCNTFNNLFNVLHAANVGLRQQLFEVMRDHQDLQNFFANPNRDLLSFLSPQCFDALKVVTTQLYCATKDLVDIINASGGTDITGHFNAYRALTVNGNICKACGMKELAAFRAGVPEGDQWRADYDHQLCKSKYPIFAVHPDNLIPLCDVCNQDAKKAKDLFRDDEKNDRLAFYPHLEEAKDFVDIVVKNPHDPEPTIEVQWLTSGATTISKLNTWDDIYEIRSRVEGRFRSLEAIIEDEINPVNPSQLQIRIGQEARPTPDATLKRKEWAFWYQKLFAALQQNDLAPFLAKWEFVHQQSIDGGEYILRN